MDDFNCFLNNQTEMASKNLGLGIWHRLCYTFLHCGCDRQSSEQSCNHHNPPVALFTPHQKGKKIK